jgi:hypothetical protein
VKEHHIKHNSVNHVPHVFVHPIIRGKIHSNRTKTMTTTIDCRISSEDQLTQSEAQGKAHLAEYQVTPIAEAEPATMLLHC